MTKSSTIRNLLIVEDDEVFRQRLARAFFARGYEVLQSSSFAECMKILQTEPSIAYAVIDLKVGEDSGLAILEQVISANPACRAVVLTGFGTISTSVTAVKMGAVDYLLKPTDPDTIAAALTGDLKNDSGEESKIPTPSLEQNEWEYINRVLQECKGNISVAAKRLGLHRRSLQRKLVKGRG